MLVIPYIGNYKKLNSTSNNDDPIDEYEVVALAKRLNITMDDMENMSFVSLINILLSSVDDKEKTKKPTQEDIDRIFG